jgi:miniconductance mechanosensitive channel
MEYLENWIETLLIANGVEGEAAMYWRLAVLVTALIVLSVMSYWVTKRIVVYYIYKIVRRTEATWDDILADNGVLNNLAHIVPALFVRSFAQIIFRDFETALPYVIKFTDAYLIAVGLTVLLAFVRVLEHWSHHTKAFKDQPLTSYFQLVRIVLYIVAGILILSVLLGRSPIYFLGAFGTISAILLLVFKDTILGLVASVQMSANDMVRVGDWVEMPKFNADGDVIAINLNTVKVQNFDRTITSIPTYFFITDSFKNWRGMQESGGRRIKRSVYLNVHSIKFVDPDTRERYKRYNLLTEFVTQRQKEIEEHNRLSNIDTSELINGRRMTNLGVFRKYVEFYLQNHPRIRPDMTIMVRQLSIDDKGVPMEVYCFTNTTVWTEYESIQADIFDHLLAAAVFFDLELFQQPSGRDISRSVERFSESIKSN